MSVKKCSKCNAAFDCCNEQRGCWCESLHVDLETLKQLREQYDNCLCPDCLKTFATDPA